MIFFFTQKTAYEWRIIDWSSDVGSSDLPVENWISPPLQPNRAHTGDVFDIDGVLWVVMSPPCDMANDGNISDVLLVRCDRDELGEWNDRRWEERGVGKECVSTWSTRGQPDQ